jgi:hypothetical protein
MSLRVVQDMTTTQWIEQYGTVAFQTVSLFFNATLNNT